VFKRLLWLTMGAGLGFGMSLWIMRVVRETVERYSPHRISSDLSQAARAVGVDVRQAVADGRDAMRQHEAELRAQVETRPASPSAPAPRHPRRGLTAGNTPPHRQ
jgi:hypothetical protein